MITITNPATTPAAELPPISTANAPAAASFADQLATESSSSSLEVEPDFFMRYLTRPASAAAPSAPAPVAPAPVVPAPVVPPAVTVPTSVAAPSPNTNDAPQPAPSYTISSTPPYFTPAPEEYVTVTPTNGMSPFPAVSMDSYLQKFIGQSVSDMYSYISGTQGWANGGASAITDNFISMVQQRLAVFPSMGEGIDPVAMGTQYANAFMDVLSGVPVAHFGATNFTGSVLDFLSQGGSPAPTVLNQVPKVLNPANA